MIRAFCLTTPPILDTIDRAVSLVKDQYTLTLSLEISILDIFLSHRSQLKTGSTTDPLGMLLAPDIELLIMADFFMVKQG